MRATEEERVAIVRSEGERWAFQALLLRAQGKDHEAGGIEARAERAARYVTKREK
jgi:hypothetical protein